MKKILFWLILALSVATTASMMTACGSDKDEPKKEEPTDPIDDPTDPINPTDPTYPSTTDSGVVINGIKWATRNVDKPGTFAANPGSEGMFYQWNRKIGWSATDPMISNVGGDVWDTRPINGDSWEKANDPSPAGWRVPTIEELSTLLDMDKVSSRWETQNGNSGRLYTDIATGATLFLPAAGYRYGSDGALYNRGNNGNYWSSTVYSSTSAYYLLFLSSTQNTYDYNKSNGFSVRCLAE